MRSKSAVRWLTWYKYTKRKLPTVYHLAAVADALAGNEQKEVVQDLVYRLGFWLVPRSDMRQGFYRRSIKVRLRSGSYALVLRDTPYERFLTEDVLSVPALKENLADGTPSVPSAAD